MPNRLGLVLSSTILDDFSRYIIAWKLCTTMKAEDFRDPPQHDRKTEPIMDSDSSPGYSLSDACDLRGYRAHTLSVVFDLQIVLCTLKRQTRMLLGIGGISTFRV